jgi:poly(3-hydroxybutyrate) depolymerase
MEASPASPFEMGEAEFTLEFLIVALDAPAQFRGIDEHFDRRVYADVFEAVGIHSGLPYKAANDLPSAFAAMKGAPVAKPALRVGTDVECRRIVFHGAADATVHPVNAERILDQARRAGLRPIETESEIDGQRVDRIVLQDAAGQPIVESWFVEGGEHAWFGGDGRGTYTQSVGLDASRLMVRFFLKR